MLSKNNRLTSSSDIKNVLVNGKSTRSGFLFFKYLPNELGFSRFAFSVGLKFSKSAVRRNSMKRKLRSVILDNLDIIAKGFDCVFVVKKTDKADQHSQARQFAINCLERSGLLKNK